MTPKPLRLAVFGTISARGGSSAMAFFRIVDEWLRGGHEVDLYSPGPFIDPAYLVQRATFRYRLVDLARWKRATQLTPKGPPHILKTGLAMALEEMQRFLHFREVAAAIRTEHRTRPYDALVVMNGFSTLALEEELPVVSFPQGPPRGESEFIDREPGLVRTECGWTGWALLRAGYLVRDTAVQRALRHSSFVVVSSRWARTMTVRAGFPAEGVAIVPPPVDLEHFRAEPRPAKPAEFRFLWLGRVVPRKRFSLAVTAFHLLRKRRPGVRLVLVGRPGYGTMIRRYRLPELGDGVELHGNVDHREVPTLFAKTDVLIQPSENENYGTAVAEALACGVPSVLGPTNGTADVAGGSAFCFDRYEPRDVSEAMERAMDAVLADPRGVAARCRAEAERELDSRAVASRCAEVIAQVVERWKPPRAGLLHWRPDLGISAPNTHGSERSR